MNWKNIGVVPPWVTIVMVTILGLMAGVSMLLTIQANNINEDMCYSYCDELGSYLNEWRMGKCKCISDGPKLIINRNPEFVDRIDIIYDSDV